MTNQIQLPLGALADWVRTTDEHATSRLVLLARVERVLADSEQVPDDQRRALADSLEKWRYQRLDACRGRLAPGDRGLCDALDLAANDLLRRERRPPRWPRSAVRSGSPNRAPTALGGVWSDPGVELEQLVRRAEKLTVANFPAAGSTALRAARKRRMLLYAPLYLSNHCLNHCYYCGFRYPLDIRRRLLSPGEAVREAEILRGRGFRHILLVAGDCPSLTTTEYYVQIIHALKERGISPAIEIAPQSTAAYAELAAAGVCGIALYQETYNEELYDLYHPRGSKRSFDWRLEGIERAAEAGLRRLGLGILLGLADPWEDLAAMIRHARYLQSRFADRTLAFSLPRIHEAPAPFQTPYPVDEETFIWLYCALRLEFPRAELVLSTRESAALRYRLAGICITQLSAGSCTAPGGYGQGDPGRASGEQFPVSDHRSPDEVADRLREAGFELAWDVPCATNLKHREVFHKP